MDGVTITRYVLDRPDNSLMQTIQKPIYRDQPETLLVQNPPVYNRN